jgi:hypothetical protein
VRPNENPRGDRDETAEPRGCIFISPRATEVAGRGVHDQRRKRRRTPGHANSRQHTGRQEAEPVLGPFGTCERADRERGKTSGAQFVAVRDAVATPSRGRCSGSEPRSNRRHSSPQVRR